MRESVVSISPITIHFFLFHPSVPLVFFYMNKKATTIVAMETAMEVAELKHLSPDFLACKAVNSSGVTTCKYNQRKSLRFNTWKEYPSQKKAG